MASRTSRIQQLSKEIIIYGIANVLGRFLTFLLTPLYTNYLPMNDVGEIINIFSILAFVNIAYSYGMDSSFFRYYEIYKTENPKQVFSNAYFSILFLCFINTLIIEIFAPQISVFFNLQNRITITRLIALIPALDALVLIPFSLLRITNQAMKFSMFRFVAILINVALNVIFIVVLHYGVLGIIVAQIISSSAALLMMLPIILKNLQFHYDFQLIKKMLAFGLPTVPASISGIILQVADKPIMRLLTNSQNVAIYGVNYRLGIPMMLFVSVFEYAWKPFYLNHYKDEDAKELFSRIFTLFTIVAMLLLLVWTYSLEFVVRLPFIGGRLIKPDYWVGLDIVPIILFGYFFNGIYINLTAGFLIEKQTKYLPIAVVTAALINILANFLLIPNYTYWGGAWATFIAYLIAAIIIYLYSRKIYLINYDWRSIFETVLISAIFIIINLFLPESNLIVLFIERLILLIAFVAILYYLKIIKYSDLQVLKSFLKFRR
ncbi:MAG TPA: oligosaccharide flippase family protein [Candidatus Kapabacteria bacterium]|nr:oligosaccharide flippase family protein [Candidatus Kapabacteria bacterium]